MLTKSEKQIMDLLWSVDKPLSCTEIVELSGDKTWKDSYVHSLIKSLMKKDVVKIESFELISRSYARKFAPKVTKEEFYLREYLEESPENNMPALFAAFAKNKADRETMNKIEDMIQNWKKEQGI
ncbi:MAG: BlaI/MecI/CopY family transcriptional regulator [Ruminococcus sp.]|nr:BlaI/MecI/CopY family transcriptional regulator [Ruminococcus sp.]